MDYKSKSPHALCQVKSCDLSLKKKQLIYVLAASFCVYYVCLGLLKLSGVYFSLYNIGAYGLLCLMLMWQVQVRRQQAKQWMSQIDVMSCFDDRADPLQVEKEKPYV